MKEDPFACFSVGRPFEAIQPGFEIRLGRETRVGPRIPIAERAAGLGLDRLEQQA